MNASRYLPLLALAVALFVAGCGPAQPAGAAAAPEGESTADIARAHPPASANVTLPTPDPRRLDCRTLDSVLFNLTLAEDPLATAERLGLPAHEGKVQVVITLAGEDTAFLAAFDAEIGSQSGAEVQAYVPPAELCALGADERVAAVRAPDLAASW